MTHPLLSLQGIGFPLHGLFLRKEVIQPQVLLQLPCYDFTPVIRPAFGGSFPQRYMRPATDSFFEYRESQMLRIFDSRSRRFFGRLYRWGLGHRLRAFPTPMV